MEEIPKIIHYCWFGGNPLPELAQKCIESWKKFCPDYEIREWNESNYDVTKCDYIKEAYDVKKWAFVSDYARYDILYQHGGLYFDTDVELIKPIDNVVAKGAFMGVENDKLYTVAPGLGLGAIKGMSFYKDILNFYNEQHFVDETGRLNTTTIVTYTTDLLKKRGMKKTKEIQCVEGINIYPKDYFCPKDYDTGELYITENTYAIHHFDGSWHDKLDKKWYRYGIALQKIFGKKLSVKIVKVLSAPERLIRKVKQIGLKKTAVLIRGKIK